MRLALILATVMLPLIGGCMAVIGYEPTEAELEAIRRGEDPRANEGKEPKPADNQPAPNQPRQPDAVEQTEGPAEGIVLRWVDASTLVIEAEARSQVVRIPNERFETREAESRALNDRMNQWTYGTSVRLTYPVKDKEGKPVYRDGEGNLLAEIR